MASSQDTIVLSTISFSWGSDETSLKEKRQGPHLGEQETVTSAFISPRFFCRPPSDSAASCSRTEWAPQNYLSTARFNEELLGLQVQASEEELEDTASSKLQPDRPIAAAAIGTDCRHKRRVTDILGGLVPSARNLMPRHVSAVRRWPSGCGRVPPPFRSAYRVPLDVRQWVPGSSNFPPPKRRHVSAVRRYPPGCRRFPPSPPPTPTH